MFIFNKTKFIAKRKFVAQDLNERSPIKCIKNTTCFGVSSIYLGEI